jgi:hypothetical protein
MGARQKLLAQLPIKASSTSLQPTECPSLHVAPRNGFGRTQERDLDGIRVCIPAYCTFEVEVRFQAPAFVKSAEESDS